MAALKKHAPLICLLLAGVICLFISTTYTNRGHYHGDDVSSIAVFNAGKNFEVNGLWRLKLSPAQGYVMHLAPDEPVQEKFFYTHYPPGPDYFQYALFRLGLESMMSHRIVAILLALLGAYFAFLSGRALFQNRASVSNKSASYLPSLCVLIVFCFSPGFLFYADSLHGFNHLIPLRWLHLLLVLKLAHLMEQDSPLNLKRWAAAFFGLSFVMAWFTMDQVPAVLLQSLVLLAVAKPAQRMPAFLIVAAGTAGEVFGFIVHVAKNAFVFGSLGAAYQDMRDALFMRTGLREMTDFHQIYNPLKHLAKFLFGIQWFYTLPMAGVALAGWILLIRKYRQNKILRSLFVATLLGAVFWQFAMRQHSMIHGFTYRHIDVFIGLGFGCFIKWTFEKKPNPRPPIWTAGAAALVLLLHTAFILLNVNFIEGRKVAINTLVPNANRAEWDCLQKNRISQSMELPAANLILDDETNCADRSAKDLKKDSTFTWLRLRLAELVLFWR